MSRPVDASSRFVTRALMNPRDPAETALRSEESATLEYPCLSRAPISRLSLIDTSRGQTTSVSVEENLFNINERSRKRRERVPGGRRRGRVEFKFTRILRGRGKSARKNRPGISTYRQDAVDTGSHTEMPHTIFHHLLCEPPIISEGK